jgi:hypothetical protein
MQGEDVGDGPQRAATGGQQLAGEQFNMARAVVGGGAHVL